MNAKPLLVRSTLRALGAVVAALLVAGLTTSLRGEDLFYLPNMEAEIFDVDNIDFGKRGEFDQAGLVKALVRIASDFDEDDDVDNELRSNALGVAGRIDPKSEAFKNTFEQLKEDAKAYGDEGTSKSRLVGNIYSGVRSLLRIKDNDDNKMAAAYCVDVALRLDPEHKYAEKLGGLKDDLAADDFTPDWDELKGEAVVKDMPWNPFGRSTTLEARKEKMPGGDADKLARYQSSIYGLVVVTLQGGKQAGAASEIIATALKEKGTKGLEFKIDQKVGNMMGNSLKSIVSFLRVQYEPKGMVPDGYEISIVFEDRDQPVDGPSAGTAMALMLDSLFSGEELDDRFACTGGITPNGKVTKIGGVAAKIRGATRRSCNIVGVPDGNAGGVNDILVLKGIEPLLDIQIFTMKNIDDARALSRKEKNDEVKSTLEDYKKVADLIRDKGESLLKNGEVQKKLQGVLDKMPNHRSAQLLLDHAKGKAPKELSVGGSFHEIDSRASGLFSRVQMMVFRDKYDHSNPVIQEAKDALSELREIDGKVDERFADYLDTAIKVCELVEAGREDDDEDVFLKRLQSKWESLQSQRKKLSTDPEVREEIMG